MEQKPNISINLPRQHNLEQAAERAIEVLGAQPPEQLQWLGTVADGRLWQLQVLDEHITVDISCAAVTLNGAAVSPLWRILILHYLGITGRPASIEPAVAAGEIASVRTYAGIFEKRSTARLCRAMTDSKFAQASFLTPIAAGAGDLAFEFRPFPRLKMRLIWYRGDDEFPPSATFLFPANIESFFCAEDIVVLSQQIVGRLVGESFYGGRNKATKQ